MELKLAKIVKKVLKKGHLKYRKAPPGKKTNFMYDPRASLAIPSCIPEHPQSHK